MSYLEDLLDQMTSTEWLPAQPGELAMSGTHDIAFMAHREAEELKDEAILPELSKLLASAKPKPRFRKALFVTACLIKNTDSKEGKDLLSAMFRNTSLDANDLCGLLAAASKALLAENENDGVSLLAHPDENVVSYAADYLIDIKSRDGVSKVGALVQESRLSVDKVINIGRIGEEWTRPVLEGIVASKRGKKAKLDVECYAYAAKALREME